MARMPRGVPAPSEVLDPERRRARSSGSALERSRRFAELYAIARRHGVVPFRKLDLSRAPETAALRATQARGLRLALQEAGGAFVKMGQLLSTRDDVLPLEYVAELSQLQQGVVPAAWDGVQALLEAELGAPITQVFSFFDPIPIAAASIGQVHRATLKTGERVAVKVQRPGIAPEVRRDVDIALRFTRWVSRSSSQAKQLGTRAIAEQYGADLIRQLDFRREAVNLAALHSMQERRGRTDEVRLPRLYDELSSENVLVMEFLEGETFSAVQTGDPRRQTALASAMRAVLRSFIRQIAFDGIYHGDLHPGNIMLLPDGTPAMIDFGSVGRLDLEIRETIQELVIAFLQSDMQLIADALLTLVPLAPGADEKAFRRDLSLFITFELGPGARISLETVDSLVAIVTSYGMTVPAEFVAAARAFAILEGTLRSTVPEFDLIEESRSIAGEQIREQMAPGNVTKMLSTEALAMIPGLRRLPRRVDQIGLALENGTLNVNVRLLADRRDRRLLIALIRQLLMVAVGAVAGVLALGYLTAPPPETPGVISTVTAGIALGIGSLVLLLGAAIDANAVRRRE